MTLSSVPVRPPPGLIPETVTAVAVIAAYDGELPPGPVLPEDVPPLPESSEAAKSAVPGPCPGGGRPARQSPVSAVPEIYACHGLDLPDWAGESF